MSDFATTTPVEAARARARDRSVGLLIVAIAFMLSLALSLWARQKSQPEGSEPPAPPTSEGLPGWPSSVDPVDTIGRARAMTKRSGLRGFVADGVRSDGTIDFRAQPASVRYVFQSKAGEGPPPPRAHGTLPKRTFCGKQEVSIGPSGIGAQPDLASQTCPVPWTDPLPDPRCHPRDVWKHAIQRGAPADKMAKVEYYRSRAGPSWRFDIPGAPQHRFSLYGDCERELTISEAVGSVP